MGVKIGDLVADCVVEGGIVQEKAKRKFDKGSAPLSVRLELEGEEVRGRPIAVDAFNMLYQYLASIRSPTGEELRGGDDMHVTSHLMGIMMRVLPFIQQGIFKPVFIFDGIPTELKAETIKDRVDRKVVAREKMEEARDRGDMETARRFASQTSHLTRDMVEHAKELLDTMGVPYIQVEKGDGEKMAAELNQRGTVWAVLSQDYDSLLFGAKRVIRNLSLSMRRRNSHTRKYETIPPSTIQGDAVWEHLEMTREQAVDLALLVGTDFNKGLKGIGAKRARDLLRTFGTLEALLDYIDDEEAPWPGDPKKKRPKFLSVEGLGHENLAELLERLVRIRKLFLGSMDQEVPEPVWGDIDEDALVELMMSKHGFNGDELSGLLSRFRPDGVPGTAILKGDVPEVDDRSSDKGTVSDLDPESGLAKRKQSTLFEF